MKCVVQSTQAVYEENAPPSQAGALENIIPPKHSYSQCSAKCQLLYAHGWFQRHYQSPFCLYLFFLKFYLQKV